MEEQPRVWLPDEECERLRRSEMEAMRCLLGAVSYTATAQDGIKNRLSTMIPDGQARMDELIKGMRSLLGDLVGTVPSLQAKQLQNTMKDMELRMVPKLSGMTHNVILEKDVAKGLIDAAMEKCHGCVETNETCKQCRVYQVLEATTPLEEYDNGLICAYSTSEWED